MASRPDSRVADGWFYPRSLPAFADGPVADTAETVTPQPVVSRSDSDRDDMHTMGHCESMRA